MADFEAFDRPASRAVPLNLRGVYSFDFSTPIAVPVSNPGRHEEAVFRISTNNHYYALRKHAGKRLARCLRKGSARLAQSLDGKAIIASAMLKYGVRDSTFCLVDREGKIVN